MNERRQLSSVEFLVHVDAMERVSMFAPLTHGKDTELLIIQRRGGTAYRAVVAPRRSAAAPTSIQYSTLAAITQRWRKEPKTTRVLETGIKVIDLFHPVPEEGSIAIFGGRSVGRMSLQFELHRRLAGRARDLGIVFLVVPEDAHLVAQVLAEEPGYPLDVEEGVESLWIPSDAAQDTKQVSRLRDIHCRLFLSASKMALELYPCIDPLLGESSLLRPEVVGVRHVSLATRALDLLNDAERYLSTPAFDDRARAGDTIAARAIRQRKYGQMLDSASDDASKIVRRARLLELYLTQTFHCAAPYTGVPGTHVPRAVLLDDVERLLSGELDNHPDESVAYIGELGSSGVADRIARFWRY
jgi:F0F1-type ATP synthase beta subunit